MSPFIVSGAPVPVNAAGVESDDDLLSIKKALSKHSVPELKDMLKAKKLAVQGRKDILIGRLAEALTLDEGVNGGEGDVGNQRAGKKQCRRNDDVAYDLERGADSPGSGFEEPIPDAVIADAVNGAVPADELVNEELVNEDAGEEEEESGDFNDEDDEEEGYDSVNDNLF
jgi:hypothetical protein